MNSISFPHLSLLFSLNRRANGRNPFQFRSSRHFSVKELSWCAPSESPNKNRRATTIERLDKSNPQHVLESIEKFGIVAAMTKQTNVIGINGRLPWNLPEEREMFQTLTRNKILVLGRRTFEEEKDQSHISHCAHSIIVSRTLKWDQCEAQENSIHVVPSFQDALHVARGLATQLREKSNNESDDLLCWIAGGERLYQDALKHQSAERVHLTLIEKNVPIDDVQDYSRFPSRYRWDNKFRIISREKHISTEGDVGVAFETLVYKRIRSMR